MLGEDRKEMRQGMQMKQRLFLDENDTFMGTKTMLSAKDQLIAVMFLVVNNEKFIGLFNHCYWSFAGQSAV